MQDPLSKPKESFRELIDRLSTPDSPVGIDAKYTHAVIIDYLQQMADTLQRIDERISALEARTRAD